MSTQQANGHAVYRLTAHVVWSTKLRYNVLEGETQKRCRKLLKQICDSEDVTILKGVVSSDHIHIYIEYDPSKKISNLVKKLKGKTSKRLQKEFPKLKKKYWGSNIWATGFGCWSTGNTTDEMVNDYLKYHKKSRNDYENFILE